MCKTITSKYPNGNSIFGKNERYLHRINISYKQRGLGSADIIAKNKMEVLKMNELIKKTAKKVWQNWGEDRLDIDTSKVKCIDFINIVERVLSSEIINECNLFERISRIYNAISQVHILEDFGMAKSYKPKTLWAEGLDDEYFLVNGKKITAFEIIQERLINGIPITANAVKREIIGSPFISEHSYDNDTYIPIAM